MSRLFFSRYAFQVVLPPVYACSHIRQILKAPKLTGLQIHAQSRDSDSRYEPLAVLGPETGELSELERMNGEGEAERFIRQLEEPAWAGIEACGTASGLPRFCGNSRNGVPWCHTLKSARAPASDDLRENLPGYSYSGTALESQGYWSGLAMRIRARRVRGQEPDRRGTGKRHMYYALRAVFNAVLPVTAFFSDFVGQ